MLLVLASGKCIERGQFELPSDFAIREIALPKVVRSMCPDCKSLSTDPRFAHPKLKWRMVDFDPTTTETLAEKLFEECSVCKTRWFDQRTEFIEPRKSA